MIEILKSVEKYTATRIAVVENGVVKTLSGDHISHHVLLYKTPPDDGIYILLNNTCGGYKGCKVGRPSEECKRKGNYDPDKCAVISFKKAESFNLTLQDLCNIVFE